jgi:hypothetical protein
LKDYAMTSTIRHKVLATASATAIGALGVLMAQVPAHAAPGCAQYGFPGQLQIFEGDVAYAIRTTFSSTGPTASGPADRKDTSGKASTGTISGDIKGRKINLLYTSDIGAKHFLIGDIGDDGIGHGLADVIDGTNTPWSSAGPFTCLDAAAPGGKPDIPPGMGWVNGDVDMYDKPGGVGNKYPDWLEGGATTEGPDRGQLVKLITCQDDNWCNVVAPGIGPVWVWGESIDHHQ